MSTTPFDPPARRAPFAFRFRAAPGWVPTFTLLGAIAAAPFLWMVGIQGGAGALLDVCSFTAPEPLHPLLRVVQASATLVAILLGAALTGSRVAQSRSWDAGIGWGILTPFLPATLTTAVLLLTDVDPSRLSFGGTSLEAMPQAVALVAGFLLAAVLFSGLAGMVITAILMPVTGVLGGILGYVAQRSRAPEPSPGP